jgi:hypothetical protein
MRRLLCRLLLQDGRHDDWTPGHLARSPTNLYSAIAIALKGAEWRQPGLVALASTLALSACEHSEIKFDAPTSYEPKTGPNPWRAPPPTLECNSQVVHSQALPEPVDAGHASEPRATQDASEPRATQGAAMLLPPPPIPDEEVERASMPSGVAAAPVDTMDLEREHPTRDDDPRTCAMRCACLRLAALVSNHPPTEPQGV